MENLRCQCITWKFFKYPNLHKLFLFGNITGDSKMEWKSAPWFLLTLRDADGRISRVSFRNSLPFYLSVPSMLPSVVNEFVFSHVNASASFLKKTG